MWTNSLKKTLAQGQPVAGAIVQIDAPALVEVLALSGFDFVFLDAEHGAFGPEACENLVRAAEATGITPLVRVPDNQPHLILRYLDTGAHGVIVPHVTTGDDAQRAVDAAYYHPLGHRGLAGHRASRYNLELSTAEYTEHANRELAVIGLIEDIDALDHMHDILSVDGLSAIHIGPTDLSQSMGLTGQRRHPEVEQAIDKIIARANEAGIPVGIATGSGDDALAMQQRGCQITTTVAWALLASAGREYLAIAREAG